MLAATPELSSAMLDQAVLSLLLCAAPLGGVLGLGLFSLFVRAVQWCVQRFITPAERTNRFEALLYAFAAIVAPLNILALPILLFATTISLPPTESALSAILANVVNALNFILLIYQLFLLWLAVQAIYAIKGWQAALALSVPLVGGYVLLMLYLGVLV
jgi:hypothetical protein